MEKRLKKIILEIAHYTELVVSVLIIGSIFIVLLSLVGDLIAEPAAFLEMEHFHEFLSNALTLVVGI